MRRAFGDLSEREERWRFLPELRTVETRGFFRDFAETIGSINLGYHWFGNGETYYYLGTAMGRAMGALLDGAWTQPYINTTVPPAPNSTASSRIGRSVTPAMGARNTLLQGFRPPICIGKRTQLRAVSVKEPVGNRKVCWTFFNQSVTDLHRHFVAESAQLRDTRDERSCCRCLR